MFFAGNFILDLIRFAGHHGIRKEEILQTINHNESDLSKAGALVDYQDVSQVFELIEEQKIQNFGLLMGEQITLSATAYVDQIMDSCQNVQEAFEHAVAYSRLISDAMQCELIVTEKDFNVTFTLNPEWAVCNEYAIVQNLDMAMICAVKALGRLTQKSHFPRRIDLFYPKPKHLNDHYRLFDCQLNFKESISSITFDKRLFSKSNGSWQNGLLETLRVEADELLKKLPTISTTIYQVKQAMLSDSNPRCFELSYIADQLNTTPRTLQRKLRQEGTSFRAVRSELRFQLARKLSSEIKSIEELAYLLGYSESSAFVRAFRNWTGKSPRRFLELKTTRPSRR